MQTSNVNFCWLLADHERDLHLPNYETKGSAGMDVEAAISESIEIISGDIILVPTGFAIELPSGYEMQVRPRSGLAVKHGITIVNSPGTIDSDYRGEVKIALINLGKKSFTINRGDRIAQLVLARISRAKICQVTTLNVTDRGTGGFGHTGV